MYDEDQDTLAAEYVLGTLSADERDARRGVAFPRSGVRGGGAPMGAAARRTQRHGGSGRAAGRKFGTRSKRRSAPLSRLARLTRRPRRSFSHRPKRGCAICRLRSLSRRDRQQPTRRLDAPAEPPTMLSPPVPEAGKVERGADVIYLARPGQTLAARGVSVSARSPRCWRFTSPCGRSRPTGCRRSCGRRAAQDAGANSQAPARAAAGSAGRRLAAGADGAGIPAHARHPAAYADCAHGSRRQRKPARAMSCG